MSQSRLVAGAHVFIFINGEKFSKVSSFRWEHMSPHRKIRGVDNAVPLELAVTSSEVTGTVGAYRLIGDGGLEGAGISSTDELIPKQKYFSFSLVERQTDIELFRADKCMVDMQEWGIEAKTGFLKGTFRFTGLKWSNETRQLRTITRS